MPRYRSSENRIYEFEKEVEWCAINNSSDLLANNDELHAKIIIKNLFLNANSKIRIFTGSFRDDIYEDRKSVV